MEIAKCEAQGRPEERRRRRWFVNRRRRHPAVNPTTVVEPPKDGRTDVILVHGTFAKNAPWTQSGSRMTTHLTLAGLSYEAFPWSGSNSHHARIEAAQMLADRLRALCLDNVPVAVVAHSHGGNIALHAVDQLRGQPDLPDPQVSIPVVTLATPFFFAKRHKTYPVVFFGAACGALVLFATGLAILLQFAINGRTGDSRWLDAAFILAVAVVVAQLIGLGYWLKVHGPPWRTKRQDRFIDAVQVPAGDDGLLVIRAADDEASSSLGIAQFSGWLGSSAIRWTRPSRWIGVYLVLALLGFVLDLVGANSTSDLLSSLFAYLAFVACGLCLLLVSGPAIMSSTQGLDGMTASLFAFVSAEASPPGAHTIRQRPIEGPEATGMEHSSLYGDCEVIGWVVEHVKAHSSGSRDQPVRPQTG